MTREGTADDPPRGPENTPRIVDRTKNNVTIVTQIPSQDPSPRLPPHSYPPRGTSNCRSGSRAPQDPISSRLGSLAPSNDRSLPEPLRSRFVLSTCCATPGASSSIDGATGDLTLYLSNARASAPWNDVKASLRPPATSARSWARGSRGAHEGRAAVLPGGVGRVRCDRLDEAGCTLGRWTPPGCARPGARALSGDLWTAATRGAACTHLLVRYRGSTREPPRTPCRVAAR